MISFYLYGFVLFVSFFLVEFEVYDSLKVRFYLCVCESRCVIIFVKVFDFGVVNLSYVMFLFVNCFFYFDIKLFMFNYN